MSIPLGSFALERCIGHGGMAEVWRGRHRDFPVAVKIMTSKGARSEHFRTVFRGEVHAVAALRHPGIVEVLDHGVVGREAQEASRGALEAGNPFLVMELLSGATLLEQAKPEPTWERVREVLLALLAALAHAHARGVIHRDLKLSNVLVDEGAPAGIKLADFGLAYAIDDPGRLSSSDDLVIGTPSCMAPEQIQGQWRDYGPWTDLYGLGCLAWELAAGTPLYGGGPGMLRVVRCHLEEPPGVFEPRLAVPAGFEAWLRRLLEKDAGRRFVRAADAAMALRELPDPAARPRRGREEPAARRSPQELADWRLDEPVAAPTTLLGAGLGLYGVREPGLVGREEERDRLWSLLREALAARATRVAVLRGQLGSGKTRLAEWLARRAHENGAAIVLRAGHAEIAAPTDGLAGMLRRHFRCAALDHADTARRVERLLRARHVQEPAEWQRIADLIAGAASGVAPRPAPLGDERYELVERHLLRLNRQRGVLLVLDDCQWGADTLAFAEFLLRRHHDGPLVAAIVVVARTGDELDPEVAERLSALERLAGGRRVPVEPFDAFHARRLVRALLGLDGELVETVAERSGGNPLFAVQAIGDWVQRGILTPGVLGFEVARDADVALPASLRQVWAERLAAAVPATAHEALELAAALGPGIAGVAWRAACAESGLELDDAALDALLRAGLARREDDGAWSFAHGMLREALETRAREAGRWARHHAACARALRALPAGRGPDRTGLDERLGRHLVEAGEPRAALAPLLAGARARRESSDYAAALRLVALRERALAALAPADEVAASDWGEGWNLRARILLHEGRAREARRWAERACRVEAPAISAEAYRLLGDAARRLGEHEAAQALYRVAIAAEATPHSVAASLYGLADSRRQRGETAELPETVRRAREIYATIGDAHGVADTCLAEGDLARHAGAFAGAEASYRAALERFEVAGNRYGVARAWNGLGDAARLTARFAVAESFYRRSAEALHDLGSADETFPRLNLALLALARGRADATLELLEELWPRPRALGWGALLPFLSAAQFAAAAVAREWGTAEAALLEIGGARLAIRDPDLALALTTGAAACTDTAHADLGRRAEAIARLQQRPGAAS